MKMAITIAVANQKGGVGKTTTCVNLTAALKKRGRRVLLVDCDPQGNSTSGMGVDKQTRPNCYDMMINGAAAEDCVCRTKWGDVLPANVNLSGCSVELVQLPKREQVMKTALEPIRDDYDFILIDCSPSLGLITINALTASDSVIIPVQCEFFALEGIAKLLNTIKIIKSKLNPALKIEGFLLTMFDNRLRLSNQVYEEVKRHFGDLVFNTVIARNVRLSEAPSHGVSVLEYDPHSKGAQNYTALAREVIVRNKQKQS